MDLFSPVALLRVAGHVDEFSAWTRANRQQPSRWWVQGRWAAAQVLVASHPAGRPPQSGSVCEHATAASSGGWPLARGSGGLGLSDACLSAGRTLPPALERTGSVIIPDPEMKARRLREAPGSVLLLGAGIPRGNRVSRGPRLRSQVAPGGLLPSLPPSEPGLARPLHLMKYLQVVFSLTGTVPLRQVLATHAGASDWPPSLYLLQEKQVKSFGRRETFRV